MSDAEYMCYGYPDYSIKMSVYLILYLQNNNLDQLLPAANLIQLLS